MPRAAPCQFTTESGQDRSVMTGAAKHQNLKAAPATASKILSCPLNVRASRYGALVVTDEAPWYD